MLDVLSDFQKNVLYVVIILLVIILIVFTMGKKDKPTINIESDQSDNEEES